VIQNFIDRFMANQAAIEAKFKAAHPESYEDIVRVVVDAVKGDEYDHMDPSRIHTIDDGDYQGTLLFVIASSGYKPSKYWYVKVGYGSCSGCDTLQDIRGYTDEPVTDQQLRDYMTLALHIVQGLKEMSDDES
jgi:hypothetical protein